MATENLTGHLNLRDYAKTLNRDGTLAVAVEEYAHHTTLAGILPITAATEKDRDTGYFRDTWQYGKHSSLADLTNGPTPTKHTRYEREDTMGYRESAIGFSRKQMEYAGSGWANLVADEVSQHVRDLALDVEHDMFWGDPREDDRNMLGLMPRFGVLTDIDGKILSGDNAGMISPYKCYNGGDLTRVGGSATTEASSGALGSILIVHPSVTDGVCLIYPKDAVNAGFQYSEGEFTRMNYDNGVLDYRYDTFSVMEGISVRNRGAVVRIANIDYTSDEGIEAMMRALYDAVDGMPDGLRGGNHVYCPRHVLPAILWYFNTHKYATSASGAYPEGIGGGVVVAGFGEFHTCEHLTVNEEYIS